MSRVAVVFGASGGIGGALVAALETRGDFDLVLGYSRRSFPAFELTDEASISARVGEAASHGEIRLAIDATGVLHDAELSPEKSWREVEARALQRAFAINATGPMLLMKHLLPRLPREGRAVFATLSARVGSIGDNRLGGWYGYRASKAALNQFLRSAAVELARLAPDAICVALHPGTVATGLSQPFAKRGLTLHRSEEAAANLLSVFDGLTPAETGGFFDWRGEAVPW
jgi:hypothetical protein